MLRVSIPAICLSLVLSTAFVHAQNETFYVERGADWSLFRGQSEASNPVDAWRLAGFDDSSWEDATTPVGYGDPPYGTNLDDSGPQMRGNYLSIFLRREFDLTDPDAVVELHANINYDDGALVFINGVEVWRLNVSGSVGDPIAFDDNAVSAHEQGNYENVELLELDGLLVEGTNAIGVMVFQNQVNSSDLTFDMELFDPFGPDVTAPRVDRVTPAGGATVRSLTQVEVTFDEPVDGVDNSDLLIDGDAANSVTGSGAGPYLFRFDEPSLGDVTLRWATGHGIEDRSESTNAFAGGSWSYTLDPDAPDADLVLNEVMSANVSGLRDDDGERVDWVEIWNRGTTSVDLGGYSLTDDSGDSDRWVFPSEVIGPGDYLVVFLSGKDDVIGGEIHTNFQLNSNGEFLGLYSPDSPRRQVSAFAPKLPEQRPDIAYGRLQTGELAYLDPPSPGAANPGASAIDGFAQEPVFDVPRGLYEEAFVLGIASPDEDATVYYTLNGSIPTSSSTEYTGPITIDGNSARAARTVRAVAIQAGRLPSKVVTHSYIFVDHVVTQPDRPAGFPTSWGGAPSVDYGMDPEIISSERSVVLQGLRSLPTVSLVLPTNDMFGGSGIYSNTTRGGVAWEREVSAEIIFPDGRRGTQVNCGARAHGGASRNPSSSPKHSIRLLFKGAYGASKLRFPLFDDSDVTEFDTIIFRGNYNNSWIHWDSNQRSRGTMVRDQWARDSQLEMSGSTVRGRYVNLYINGLFWGVYNPSERPNADFGSSYFGGEKRDYDAINSGQVVDGDGDAWNALFGAVNAGLASNSNYQRLIEDHLDIDHFIDYMIVNLFGANADWPGHNWYSLTKRGEGGLWRFICWDTERIFESNTADKNVSGNRDPGGLFQALRANAEFRLRFADRVQKHFFNDGALTPTRARERWVKRKNELLTACAAESARWGDYRRDVHSSSNGPYLLYRRQTHWLPEHVRIETSYLPQRTGTVLNQFRGDGLYPSLAAPIVSPHGGEIETGGEVTIRLPGGTNGDIYYTTDGSDPRLFGGEINENAEEYNGAITLFGNTQIKARTRNGSVWSALVDVLFTAVPLSEALVVSEIMYHAPEGGELDFLELRNDSDVDIALADARFIEGLTYIFPEGATLAPGDTWLLVSDLDAFEAKYPGVTADGVFEGSLDNGGERLTLADADGRLVFSFQFGDGRRWPQMADGLGWSLVYAEGDPSEPTSWRASRDRGGAPDGDDLPGVPSGVYVNEVLAHSEAPFEDAIELVNESPTAVDISGWFLSDSRSDEESLKKFVIPGGSVIEPGGFLVFYENEFQSEGLDGFALSSDGDDVFLASADGGELTGYLTGESFRASENNVSFGRVSTSEGLKFVSLSEPTFGVSAPGDVALFREGAGANNSAPISPMLVINEIHYNPLFGIEFVEIFNPSGEAIDLYDADLLSGWTVSGLNQPGGVEDFEFAPGDSIPAGGFVVLVPVAPSAFTELVDVPLDAVVLGPYGGALSGSGERLRLQRPVDDDGRTVHVTVDEVDYNDRAPWPVDADGGGPSLERIAVAEFSDDPINWDASSVDGGTPGETNSVSDNSNRRPVASFVASTAGPLRIAFDARDSDDPDGDIVDWSWDFGDGASGSGEQVSHLYDDAGSFLVRLTVEDDLGARSSVTRLIEVETNEGGQLPGDSNQDGQVDISDAIKLLRFLFIGEAGPLPCEGDLLSAGNLTVLDVNGDGAANLTDAVYQLSWLFRGGEAPVLGTECRPVVGCAAACF